MLTINGLFENYIINIDNVSANKDSLRVKIVDMQNTVSIRGFPVKFEYFFGETGKYEFKAVFSRYTVKSLEEE